MDVSVGSLAGKQRAVPQHMVIATPTGKTNAVEVFQNLHRQFAADIQLITKIRCAGRAIKLIARTDQIGKLLDAITAVVAIFDDRRNQPKLSRLAQ